MVIFIIGIVVVGAVLIYGWIKLVNAVLNPLIEKLDKKKARITMKDNYYVQAHLIRENNDQMYEEYLNWLDKTGGNLPIDKILTEEEVNFRNKMNRI